MKNSVINAASTILSILLIQSCSSLQLMGWQPPAEPENIMVLRKKSESDSCNTGNRLALDICTNTSRVPKYDWTYVGLSAGDNYGAYHYIANASRSTYDKNIVDYEMMSIKLSPSDSYSGELPHKVGYITARGELRIICSTKQPTPEFKDDDGYYYDARSAYMTEEEFKDTYKNMFEYSNLPEERQKELYDAEKDYQTGKMEDNIAMWLCKTSK